MDRERRLNVLIAAVTLVAMFAVPYAVAKSGAIGSLFDDVRVDCDDFAFDQESWRGNGSEREEQAQGLAQCGGLAGLSRNEVAAMLDEGRIRHPNPERWIFPAGEANDFLGPGDGVSLNVFFGADGTVTEARLSQPLD